MRLTAILVTFVLGAVLLIPVGPPASVLWDSDKLESEIQGRERVIEVIAGLFDRNPPLYSRMRPERVKAQIEHEPDNLELSDDAAVACDRLNRHDQTIAWMTRKRHRLDVLKPSQISRTVAVSWDSPGSQGKPGSLGTLAAFR